MNLHDEPKPYRVRCWVLSGYAGTPWWQSGRVAFVTAPTPEQIAVGALEIMKQVKAHPHNSNSDSLELKSPIEWDITPDGNLWDFLPSREDLRTAREPSPIIVGAPRPKEDNFGAAALGFIIGISI